ncbi:MAG: sigma-70 family RNA polymerase sigma factor [Opitutales bacterium]
MATASVAEVEASTLPQPTLPTSRSETPAGEAACRLFIRRHRGHLDWVLRLPCFEPLLAHGLKSLRLPLPRRGIGLRAVVDSLALEHKKNLVLWVMERYRGAFTSRTALTLAGWYSLEMPSARALDEMLSEKQWRTFCEAFEFSLRRHHRRYKHAQAYLFACYEPLVTRLANRLVFDASKRPDAIQEGALGLLHAIDKVDGKSSLASYAQIWITRHIRNYLLGERFPVHVPINLASRLLVQARQRAALEKDSQKPIPFEELLQPSVALDEPSDDHPGGVTLPDDEAETPLEQLTRDEMCAQVRTLLSRLTDKQREVLTLRYGLEGNGTEQTLKSIADRIGISHQQVSMREKRALQRLESILKGVYNEGDV